MDYLLRVEPLNVRGLTDVFKTLNEPFASILSDMTRGMADRQLNNPNSFPFMPLKELTPRCIMFEVERVLQFVLSNDLRINLIHVKMPSGSVKTKPYYGVNLQTRMLRKRCMVPVQNKDELCAAEPLSQHSRNRRFLQLSRIQGSKTHSTDQGIGSSSQGWRSADTVRNRGNQVVSGCVTRVSIGCGQWGPFQCHYLQRSRDAETHLFVPSRWTLRCDYVDACVSWSGVFLFKVRKRLQNRGLETPLLRKQI